MLLEAAGFEAVQMVRRAIKRVGEAMDATQGRRPDHRVRLDAADRVFKLADVLPESRNGATFTGPVQIAWLSASPSASSFPTTPDPSSNDSTTPLQLTAPAAPLSSVTDDSESL